MIFLLVWKIYKFNLISVLLDEKPFLFTFDEFSNELLTVI